MYYFIIRFKIFYQILYRLHFVTFVLHFAKSFSGKCCNFAPDKTNRKRIVLNLNTDITLFILYKHFLIY